MCVHCWYVEWTRMPTSSPFKMQYRQFRGSLNLSTYLGAAARVR